MQTAFTQNKQTEDEMKKVVRRAAMVMAVLFAFVCLGSFSFAADKGQSNDRWGKFNQGTQGHAKEGLEDTAGKKLKDVKVPDVPKPTPVKN